MYRAVYFAMVLSDLFVIFCGSGPPLRASLFAGVVGYEQHCNRYRFGRMGNLPLALTLVCLEEGSVL